MSGEDGLVEVLAGVLDEAQEAIRADMQDLQWGLGSTAATAIASGAGRVDRHLRDRLGITGSGQ